MTPLLLNGLNKDFILIHLLVSISDIYYFMWPKVWTSSGTPTILCEVCEILHNPPTQILSNYLSNKSPHLLPSTTCALNCSQSICVLLVCASLFTHVFCLLCVYYFSCRMLARSQYPEGPTTSHLAQVFLGFPVSISECWDGSQYSKLLLHSSHVALPT